MIEAHIEATRHKNGAMYYDTYEWVGSKYGTASISIYMWSKGAMYSMPWPLKIVGTTDFMQSYEVVRKDVGWHLWWRLVFIKHKLLYNKYYYHFKWRVIKTFEIWGIGYQPEAEVTLWRNIWRKRK
jgi:hypothetical protein